MKKECLFTERLVLRKVRSEDASAMFSNWANDPEVTKYMTWNVHENVEITKQIIGFWLEEEKDPSTIRYMITTKECDEVIGSIDVVGYENGNPVIGYCLSREHWNKGYITEACKTFLEYLKECGFKEILVEAMEDNIASNRVIEKCGFKFINKETRLQHPVFKPVMVTIHKYSLKF